MAPVNLSLQRLAISRKPTSYWLIFKRAVAMSVPRSAMSDADESLIPSVPESVMSGEDKSLNRFSRTESVYKLGKQRSNALDLISKVAPIEIEGDMAICDGGGGALGHPLEYIKVGNRNGLPVACIYCGLRYVQKSGGH